MLGHPSLPLLVLALGLASASCASAGANLVMHPTSPFTEADGALFEDGVDLVGDPEGLSGAWADEWANSLRDRVQRSDLVALLTINTLRSEVSPEQRTTHWLVAEVGDVFKGKYSGELSLSTSDDSVGFDSVDRERAHLLHRPLLVFAKWARDENGTVRARWHLAIGARNIIDAVRVQLKTQPDASKTTVIEHTQ